MVSQEISHYRIIKRLGAGGMGEVFLAEDIRLSRKVAIKMLPARSIGNEQAKRRLFREARAAATLDHPNICAIHEVGEEGDCAFIVMQYIEGITLSRSIKNNPLSPLEIVNIGIQAAEALAEAHSHGIIHRDIKPQNVIVTSRGQIKILDFGLAKIVQDDHEVHSAAETESRLTDTGEVVGTVGYMSPEQLKDLPIDARTDLFSLGVTLYECATGKSAFSGSSKIQISLQVIQFDPPRPSQLNPDIPFELDEVILKAIAKDVDARYQSAGEMLADLSKLQGALQDGSAFNTRPLTPEPGSLRLPVTAGLSRALRRTPARLKVGILLVPAVVLGIWLVLRVWHPPPHQPSPEAKTWYDEGILAMRLGAYYQASQQLEQSISIDDGFALAHARLAQTYIELENTDKAMEEMLRANLLLPDRSGLTSLEGAYVAAVEATVGRVFSKAIESYQKLADEAPDSDKAGAYVDLGRAYERNQNIDKAQQYYVEAIKKDPQSASAFLRLAILYGRRQDSKSAEDAFNEAERLYTLKYYNEEGKAEVFYQRGGLAKTKQLSEARKYLEEALDISQKAKNTYQIVKTRLQLSAVYFDEGDTGLAKSVATEAVHLATFNKIQNLATNGMIDLGATFLSRGEFDESDQLFRQALDFAQRDRARTSEARAKYWLGALLRQKGNADEAIRLLEDARTFYQHAGYNKETSNALLEIASAYIYQGNYDAAWQTLEQVRQLAQDLDDQVTLAAAHSRFATLLGVCLERYPEALAHLDKSYSIHAAQGSKMRVGYDQMNRANPLWQLGRYQEATDALVEASSIANQPEASFKVVLAYVHLENSQMALSERHFADAKAKGEQALELAGTQYREVAANAKYCIALAKALSGAPLPARRECEEAVAMAKEAKKPRLLSSALLALAEVLLLANDAPSALATALEAQGMFERAGQQDSEWRALLIAARASQLAGNKSAMQDYASRADGLCAGLQQKWGAEAYKGYLSRPDIQAYRKQIAQILTRSK